MRRNQLKLTVQKRPIRVGICLAQPYFYENINKTSLFNSLLTVLVKLYHNHNIEYHILAFNYDKDSNHECDIICNNEIIEKLSLAGIDCIVHNIEDPLAMIKTINEEIDVNLCMRYHSVMFSVITNTRFVPIFVSSKIGKLLADINYDSEYIVEMQIDSKYKPLCIDENKLYDSLTLACKTPHYVNNLKIDQFNVITKYVLEDRKHAKILITDTLTSFDDVLISCRHSLCKYLHIDNVTYENIVNTKGPLPTYDKTSLQIARFICFIISGKTHHPCVWGLADKLSSDDFNLYESIQFIWNECKHQHDICEKLHAYYPSLNKVDRRILLNLDYVFQNDFSQYHRSGWSYVIGGLMNLDAQHIMKSCNVMIDTYIDRSFHWGYDILKNIGMVPYIKPWYGFVHHTFDDTHSEYNCNNLIKNIDFQESLKQCRGILVLSQYLANQFREELNKIGYNVPVYVLYHPMEFVDNVFTIDKFLLNPKKRIVQIGAWLRNPYGIYALPLSPNKELCMIKTALKGKEMDQYFPPPGFLKTMDDMLLNHNWFAKKNECDHCCRDICRNHMCRQITNTNKYCEGLYNHIIDELKSVEILEKLSNEDYDKLLSENLVFLNLIDCSAVNTVLECIVRNTPLIVNRIPAVEEILGKDYPGFYDTIGEAANICQDINVIIQIHVYLSKLNKERYSLEHFINRIQQIVNNEIVTTEYKLFKQTQEGVFNKKYAGIKKFLPRKFFTS
jgi:hypothetical protein